MDYDLFVIGGGSGGVRAARIASNNGLKVGLAEGLDLGGTCVNRGCIPKKLYSYSAHFPEEIKVMENYGWTVGKTDFSWSKLVKNKKKELKRLNNIYKKLLSNAGVDIFKSWAKISGKNEITLTNSQKFKVKNILIAVGGEPIKPDIKGSQFCITSDEAFDLKALPKKILVIGSGYIALEFASIFNGLGVDTTLCARSSRVLRGFDQEVTEFLVEEMEKKGVKFLFNSEPLEIIKSPDRFNVKFKNFSKDFDIVMAAIGRKAKTNKLNLVDSGVEISKNGSVVVGDYFNTSCSDIFAIGDVIDKVQLTPVAISEAMILVNNFINKKKMKINYSNIPTAIFSHPNMASIGLSENEAKRKYEKVDIYKSKFRTLKFSITNLQEKVFIKLLVDSKSDKVVGLNYVGQDAAEIVQGFAVAIVAGLKKSDFDNTIGIHPSSAEEIVTMREKTL